MNIKKNFSLILGISIPVLMIILVAGSIYLPGLFVHPKTNFLYVTNGPNYYATANYSVNDGKVLRTPTNTNVNPAYMPPPSEPKIYYYDVTHDVATEISYADAQKFNLDTNKISPDGYEVVYGNRDGGIFSIFGGYSDYNTRYIKGHNFSKKLNLTLNGSYYDFYFLGWVK